jgi:CheY-like chemotaxis protein
MPGRELGFVYQQGRFNPDRRAVECANEASYAWPVAIRLVLAEDSYLAREGIRRLLETQPGLELVASCGDLDSLLRAVEAEKPDVVLTDIRMPPDRLDEGIRAAQRLREASPEVGVVVLSQYSEPGYALALLESGSERRAYLLKERVDDLEQLVSAIRSSGLAPFETDCHPASSPTRYPRERSRRNCGSGVAATKEVALTMAPSYSSTRTSLRGPRA